MSGSLAAGLAAAIGAAVLYGAAPAAQGIAARRVPATLGTLRLLGRLVRQPLWLLGLAGEAGGFVLEATAFAHAPVTLVAPVMALDVLVFVAVGWVAFHARPSRAGAVGALALGAGLALLALSFGGNAELGRPASTATQLALLGAAVAAGGAALIAGRRAQRARRAVLAGVVLGGTAGAVYGVATLATRQIGRTFTLDHPLHLLTTPAPYLLAASSVLAVAVMQRGLQAEPLLTFPLVSGVSALLPVVVGTTLLDDQTPTGGHRVLFVAAFALVVAAIALLARDRAAAERATD